MDGSKRIADVAENITRKSIVHVADYVVDVAESVANVSNAETSGLLSEKGNIYQNNRSAMITKIIVSATEY